MRIAVDAMGGDNGPGPLVTGALLAAQNYGIEVCLVGDKKIIEEHLRKNHSRLSLVSIEHAGEVVQMDESARESLRKKDSSISVAAKLVKEGAAHGLISAGNTGATLASTLMQWRPLKGVDRPAIAALLPTHDAPCILLDAGAVVDCKPRYLLQFATMGMVYAREVLGRKKPRIGILSIGEEESKGNELTFKSFELLKRSHLNFIGNAEGSDILKGDFDVVVCDGFVGNVILKFGEAFGELIFSEIKNEIKKNPIYMLGALLTKPALRKFKKRVDYSEYGGAPLLGINGVCIIGHGTSNPKAIMNAIRTATEFADHKVNKKIQQELELDRPLLGD